MQRLVLVISIILAVFVLVNVSDGSVNSDDIFSAVSVLEAGDDLDGGVNPDLVSIFLEEEEEEARVYGSIISYELEDDFFIKDYFTTLKANQDVDTFVILAENQSLQGQGNISVAKQVYKTDYGYADTDISLVEEIYQELGVYGAYGNFYEEESLINILPYIERAFPDASILPIQIKDFMNKEELDELGEYLAGIDGDVVVIAPVLFSKGLTENAEMFHNLVTNNVMESFDKSGLEDLDTSSSANLYALFAYLEAVGAKEAKILGDNFVDFYEGEPVDDRDISIMAFGDMMLGRHVRVMMDNNGQDYVFRGIRGEGNAFLSGADIIFANLEGPIKGEGKKGGTSMNFAFNEDVAPLLSWHGFNLLSLANNHALDQGWDGRDSTIAALEREGLAWCGHPSEADPESVYYGKVGEKNFAFLCFQDITYKLDDEAAVNLIKEIRPKVDYLIVTIHWGVEYKHFPHDSLQVQPAHDFIDAGADFIIGHHPHVVQSFEIYNDKFIFYSLGNFVFDQYWSVDTQEELAIGIILDDSEDGSRLTTKVYLFPMKSESAKPRLMNEAEYSSWIEKFIGYGNYSEEMKEQIRSGVIKW